MTSQLDLIADDSQRVLEVNDDNLEVTMAKLASENYYVAALEVVSGRNSRWRVTAYRKGNMMGATTT